MTGSNGTRVIKIINKKGLHARASAKLVELVEGYDADAEVSKDGLAASGDSMIAPSTDSSASMLCGGTIPLLAGVGAR